MFCNRCGGQAPEDAAFCPFCGEILNINNAVPPVVNEVPPVMNTPVYDAPPVYYPPKRKNNSWMLVVGIIAFVVINILSIASYLIVLVPFFRDGGLLGGFDELSSPESVATVYLENFFSDDADYEDFNYYTTIDWDSVFADMYADKNNLDERDYDMAYEHAEDIFDDYCEKYVPDAVYTVEVESVTELPYTVIHNHINIFDDYFRPYGLSTVMYVQYSDIHRIHEVSLNVTYHNSAGETGTIPVIVNVAEFDGYYDVITDSLYTDSFIVYALGEYDNLIN